MENNNTMRDLYELYLELGHDVFEERIKKPMELYMHDNGNVISMNALNTIVANDMENSKLGEAGFDGDVRITEVMSKNNIFNRNERLEKNLSDKINILSNDSVTNNIIMSNLLENGESTDLNDKIKEVFNNIIWNNYKIKYIIADSSTTMVINKDTTLYNCNDFFQNIVETDGLKVNDNIWHIDDMLNIPYYLCLIQTDVYNIWIDVVPKYNLEGIGYPELLSTDESFNFHINISEYSIALYENGVLVRNIGKFVYPLYEQESKNDKIIQTEKYHHYLYQIGEGKDIIISKPHSLANYFFFPLSVVFIPKFAS